MRVAAIVEIPLTRGGGFNQSVSTVLQLQRLCGGKHELFVFSSVAQDSGYLRSLGIRALPLPSGWRDIWVIQARDSSLLRKLQQRLQVVSAFERELLRHKIDLVYFVGHSSKPVLLEELAYIATVWDLCHLDHPEFPEVGRASRFLGRELMFSSTLPRAIAVVCASASQGRKISMHYGVDLERLVVAPFDPSPFLVNERVTEHEDLLEKHGLSAGYYFYPAQFWPHKNHILILRALAELKRRGIRRHAVFTGTDQGNLGLIRDEMIRLDVADVVHFPGFVPPPEMAGFYRNAFAVVMPSYFGPTNIPPLEAWYFGIPLVASIDMAEQVEGAALLINPDSADDLVAAFVKLEDGALRASLTQAGRERLRLVEKERQATESELATRLESFAKRLGCWKPCRAPSTPG